MKFPREKFKNKYVFLFLGIILFYLCIFNHITGQIFFDYLTEKHTTADIKANIDGLSLFYGLEASSISIQEKGNISQPFFRSEKIVINYNLPLLLIGRIKISEILIENSELNLIKSEGTFNYEKIFGENENSKVEEINSDKSNEINLYFYISLYLNANIINFNFSYFDQYKSFKINNFTTLLELDSKRFNKITLNSKFIDNIDYLNFEVQPDKILQLSFKEEEIELNEKIEFYFFIKKISNEENSITHEFKLNAEKITPIYKGNRVKPLSILLNTKAEINNENLKISKLSLFFLDKKFFQGKGEIDNISNSDSKVFFEFEDSIIDFEVINDYLKIFDNTFPKLSGKFILSPFKLSGTMQNIDLVWSPNFENVRIDKYFIKMGMFTLKSNLNLFLKESDIANKLSFISRLQLENFYILFNNSEIKFNLDFLNSKLSGNLNINNLNIADFNKEIKGLANIKATINSSEITNLNIILTSELNNFQFYSNSFNIKPSNLKLNSTLNINLKPDLQFSKINFYNTNFYFQNSKSKNGLELLSSAFTYDNLLKKINIEESKINTNLEILLPLLPSDISNTISTIYNITGNPSVLISSFNYSLLNEKIMTGKFNFVLPYLNLFDLKLIINIKLNSENKNNLDLREIKLSGFRNIFNLDLNGKIISSKVGEEIKKDLNLHINATLKSESLFEFNKFFKYNGITNINIDISDDIINTNLSAEKIILEINKGECPGLTCSNYRINNLYLKMLLNHNLKINTFYSILEGDKSNLIKTIGMNKEINFKIDSITGTHPIEKDKIFTFIQGNDKDPGLLGRIDYDNNMFSISNFTLKTLNGVIASKNIQVNINRGNLEKVQYLGNMQVRDIDLTELIPIENRKKIDDGKIRGDINFTGQNLNDIVNNTEFFFSIYKIGKDFGNSAINIVSPPNIIRDYIVNSYSVDKIEAELSKGLVYVNILFKQGILSNLLTKIDNNKISQERMPLNNFINRAQDEFSTYKK